MTQEELRQDEYIDSEELVREEEMVRGEKSNIRSRKYTEQPSL